MPRPNSSMWPNRSMCLSTAAAVGDATMRPSGPSSSSMASVTNESTAARIWLRVTVEKKRPMARAEALTSQVPR